MRRPPMPSRASWGAHRAVKNALLRVVREAGAELPRDALLVGFARRATGYKRASLVLSDPERLRALGRGKRGRSRGPAAHALFDDLEHGGAIDGGPVRIHGPPLDSRRRPRCAM